MNLECGHVTPKLPLSGTHEEIKRDQFGKEELVKHHGFSASILGLEDVNERLKCGWSSPQVMRLLAQAFRPHALPMPSIDALCQRGSKRPLDTDFKLRMWLLASSMRPSTAKALAPLIGFTWRFCKARLMDS